MLCKWERKEKQRIPRIVAAQKAIINIGYQYVRRSGHNEVDVCGEAKLRQEFAEVP